ncbi:restriction endonuclease subunit S [Arthrobacter sp. UKPF54-2]|uniref:restriction endonuclease subunit S n=1 Tax=Arthrobacter sp. UKPF54-2 TaxID=2600159 RepID=UPI0011B173E5|nr:restriction endonuclease subunit S [Arthrobacter sp. UKPF54-2]QDY89672.1 restriction endonuclease subunit S [Arthrobacter sp. UKPF54-2]
MRTVTLGEVCRIESGGTPSRKDPGNFGGQIPWVKIGDMLQGQVTGTAETISETGLSTSTAKLWPAGTLLVSIFATIGRTAVLGIPASSNQAIAGLQVDPKQADTSYLRHFLDASVGLLSASGRGIAQNNINLSMLKAWRVPLPPLDEQRRIAAILDNADELRTKRRQALAHLDTLTQSIFQRMESEVSSVPRMKLAEVCIRIQTGPFGSLLHKGDYVDGGVPLVNPMHIRDGKIVADSSFSVSVAKFTDLESFRLLAGDVVLGRRGEIGRCAEVLESHGPMLCGTGSLIIRPSAKHLVSTYLCAVLSGREARNRLTGAAQGATMLNLNTKIVGNLEIAVPPLELQQAFATRVAAVERLKETHRKHLAELDALFASLQDRAFKGEL